MPGRSDQDIPADSIKRTLFDSNGLAVGPITGSYADSAGVLQWVEVAAGGDAGPRKLVPADRSQILTNGLQVPYTRQAIRESPGAAPAGNAADTAAFARLRQYYSQLAAGGGFSPAGPAGPVPAAPPAQTAPLPARAPAAAAPPDGNQETNRQPAVQRVPAPRPSGPTAAAPTTAAPTTAAPTTAAPTTAAPTAAAPTAAAPTAAAPTAAAAQDITAVRDLGDVIEVPVVEEQLVRMPVVKEIIRIRKTRQTERQMVDANLRKEDVVVEQSGDVQARDVQVQDVRTQNRKPEDARPLPDEPSR